MKTMILCAGLGTRLRPWTLEHPKALVPVGGVPMLKRVVDSLASQGFDEVTINVHHFADQIKDYLNEHSFPVESINISDETDCLLDTGGGILFAERFLAKDDKPFLVHNVDILSNADLRLLYKNHLRSGRHISLLVSDRNSDRRLVFDGEMNLKGWINLKTDERKPAYMNIDANDKTLAFSGIYIMNPEVYPIMKENGFSGKFPVMDFLLSELPGLKIGGECQTGLEIIDIGKPDTLRRANLEINKTCCDEFP